MRLCAVGICAWSLVLLLFALPHAVHHVRLPEEEALTLYPLVFLFFFLFDLFLMPIFLLFTVGIGILALGKAKSGRAKWIVALVHFSAPIAYVCWLRP